MPVPFQSATWKKRSDIPTPTLFGVYSGAVNNVFAASMHKDSGVVQTLGPVAHGFTKYWGASQASLDNGKTWFSTYEGTETPHSEFVFKAFSLDTPSGTYHYQVRADLEHAFLIADGSLVSGGVKLYVTDFADVEEGGLGTGFFPLQQLYTWPGITADPPSTGGNSVLSIGFSFSAPVLIEGSGPDGEDAFWAACAFQIDAGGTNNRQSIKRMDIWRSVDGLAWENVRDLSAVTPFSLVTPCDTFGDFKSSSGKVFLIHGGGLAIADDPTDLVNTTWTASVGVATPNSLWYDRMYGGTWITFRNGSLISGGFIQISCDDGENFQSGPAIPTPVNRNGYGLKIGPSEVIFIIAGFTDPTSETVCWYSSDGGETWAGGEVWIASTVGEQPIAAFMMNDGHPIVITTQRAFISSDIAAGNRTIRTVCPLANAGLASARKLVLCGGVITPDCQED